MKHIVFIIVLFLIFYKTFALKYFTHCDELGFEGLTFLADNQVSLTISGPKSAQNLGYFPCCLQQGPMMISNYTFYYNHSLIYTISSGPTWENGYTERSILNTNDCFDPKFDCSEIYEGDYNYTRVDSYDPKKFPAYGETIGLAVTVYAQCFNLCETICYYSCNITSGLSYEPPQ